MKKFNGGTNEMMMEKAKLCVVGCSGANANDNDVNTKPPATVI